MHVHVKARTLLMLGATVLTFLTAIAVRDAATTAGRRRHRRLRPGPTSSTAPAGSAPNGSKWKLRHRRRRLGQQRAAVLHQQHQQRRARRRGQPGHHRPPGEPGRLQCWYGTCQYTSARLLTARPVHPGVRPLRGPHQDPARPGHLAGVLDARRRHRQRPVAQQRRDRHHGEHRPRARAPSTAPCTAPATPAASGIGAGYTLPAAAVRRRVPHLRGRVGAERRSPGTSTASSTRPARPRRPGRQPLGLRPPVLHDPEPRGRRQLARLPRRRPPRSRRR